MLILPLGWSYYSHSWWPIVLFVVFAVAGVLGEALFSAWWHMFYAKKFWEYRVETLVHGYTSLLNFIPWGVGGLLYILLVNLLTPAQNLVLKNVSSGQGAAVPFYIIFSISFLLGLAIQSIVWGMRSGRKFVRVDFENYLFFYLPFLLGLSSCAAVYGGQFLFLAVWFAVIGAASEYVFGKAVEFYISKKLWVYNYEAVDKGHFTPLSLLPFSLAGFYFWGIALIVRMF